MTGGRAPSVIVYSLPQALAAATTACDLGVPLVIESAAGAGGSSGVGWFVQLADLVRERAPGADLAFLLDCADEAGTVLAAFRRGLTLVRFTGPTEVAERLRAIAATYGAALIETPSLALDLLDKADPEAACRDWLAKQG